MVPQFPERLQLPQQETIALYLQNHPLTDGSDSRYLQKKEAHLNTRIIEVVSRALKEGLMTPKSLMIEVERTIDDEKTITLSSESRLWVIVNLTHALQQCAKGMPIMRF